MTSRSLTDAVRRRWLVILAGVVVGVIAAAGYSATLTTQYVSSSRLYVSVQSQTGTSSDALQNAQAAQQRLVSYASLATSAAVTEAVISDMNLAISSGDLASRIAVAYPPGTVLLDLSTSSDSPASAQQLTSAVDDQLQRLVTRIETPASGGPAAASLSVVDPPGSGVAMGTSTTTLVGLGLLGGLILGLALAYVRERFDHTVRTVADMSSAIGSTYDVGPVTIDVSTEPGSVQAPDPATGSAMRTLRSRLQTARAPGDVGMVLFVTGVGTDTTALTHVLAQTFADAETSTVLIDARVPGDSGSTARHGMVDRPGLAEVLAGAAEVSDAVVPVVGAGFTMLPSGALDESTANLFASQRLVEVIDKLRATTGCIVIDSSPLEDNPEAAAMARAATNSIIAVGLDTVAAEKLRKLIRPVAEAATIAGRSGLVAVGVDNDDHTGSRGAIRGFRLRRRRAAQPTADSTTTN